jgi:CheY-like chemotaxis protein
LPVERALAGGTASPPARWFNPHDDFTFHILTRPSKAPEPTVMPRFVLLEEGETLQRAFQHFQGQVEAIPSHSLEAAMQELGRSPAQGLIINSPTPEVYSPTLLAQLPYNAPAFLCWIPGDETTLRQLGAVAYLPKPITRDGLLRIFETLGPQVKTILLTDDEPEALRLLARMIASFERKIRVLRAADGPKALEMLRQHRPDAMILDLTMPGMDGFQVLQEKVKDPLIREIPVVISSARDLVETPFVGDVLRVVQRDGFDAARLFACVRALSDVLAPLSKTPTPASDPG